MFLGAHHLVCGCCFVERGIFLRRRRPPELARLGRAARAAARASALVLALAFQWLLLRLLASRPPSELLPLPRLQG